MTMFLHVKLESFIILFTANGKGQFASRDQILPFVLFTVHYFILCRRHNLLIISASNVCVAQWMQRFTGNTL